MSGPLKKTTALTGLAVATKPHRDLGTLYNRILVLLTKLPKNSAYRQHTEKIVHERANVLQETTDVPTIEEKIGCGQVEELIMQAQYELTLVEKMQLWKPWEPLIEEPPPHQWTWPPHK